MPPPTLDEVMPLSTLRAKVEDYLQKSEALAVYWQRPIAGEQLQAEMERMARQTRQPQILEELWAALGNDPYVIAECLARPSLANRLIRNWYAHDERYHGELKRQTERELQTSGTAGQMRVMSGHYQELTWTKGEAEGASHSATNKDSVALTPEEWEVKVGELAQLFGSRGDSAALTEGAAGLSADRIPGRAEIGAELRVLPTGELSRLQEDDERFYVTKVLEETEKHLKVATVEWRKETFDTWWKKVRDRTQSQLLVPG